MKYSSNLEIVKFPTPSLLEKSVEVDLNDKETMNFIKEFQEFYKTLVGRAVGLAAPQVGKNIRVFIAQGDVYINPVITSKSKTIYRATEGCLSLESDVLYEVYRHEFITIEWVDERGVIYNQKFSGFPAEVIQHEYDHLEGILINQ